MLKKQLKVAFVTKVAKKLLERNKNFLWPDAKICEFYNKSKISKHFCVIIFCGITSVAK